MEEERLLNIRKKLVEADRLFIITQDERNKPFEDFINHYYQKFRKTGLILDVGCGDKKLHPDFIGVDPYVETDKVNVQAYMWDTPFPDNSVDFLVCMSALEHVSKFHVYPTLYEFARILKPGAAFAILVPNLEFALLSWLNYQNNGWEMDLIFGSQEHGGEYHKTGFSVDIIKEYFSNVPPLELLNIYDINAYTQLNFGIIGKKRD